MTAIVLMLALAYKLRAGDLTPSFNGLGALLRRGQANPNMKLRVVDRTFEATGAGLAAATSFQPGDVVMEIPNEDESFILGSGSGDAKERLVLGLLKEFRDDQSRWRLWLDALPRQPQNLASMGLTHRKALASLPIAVMLDQFEELVEGAAKEAEKQAFDPPFSKEEIRWAASVMESRAHSVGDDRVLSPFAAMANHHPDKSKALQVRWTPGRSARQYLAPNAIAAGDEVFTHYGAHSNLRLLMQYGFTLPNNPHLERVPVKFFELLGSVIFRVGNKFAPKGPRCKDMSQDSANALRRNREQGLPELVVSCWRLSQMDDEVAEAAVDAGLFGADELPWSRLPRKFLELDSRSYDQLAVACSTMRDLNNSTELPKLLTMADPLSLQLHASLLEEAAAWEACVQMAASRAAKLRAFLT